MRLYKTALIAAGMAIGYLSIPTMQAVSQTSNGDSDLKAEIMNKALNKPKLKNVQVSISDGTATLTGTVEVFDLKQEADKRVHHIKGVQGVRNEIQVAGPTVPDEELQQQLVKAISYDRVGYGITAFNAIAVNSQNGDVTLTGHAYGPVDADSAVAVAANTPGVKNVTNDIEVDPLSPMDDRIRLEVFRSIYGFPTLNKYAIDPVKPIRISVQNGNVTLYGVVDSKADSDAANIRANSVPGVFKVTNDLQVAGSAPKEQSSR
ncbi:MAG TPA: BON domain-containing protein [Edaphobacter sp.]